MATNVKEHSFIELSKCHKILLLVDVTSRSSLYLTNRLQNLFLNNTECAVVKDDILCHLP